MGRKPQLPGAFDFMKDRPYDVFITAQPHDEKLGIRKVVLMYAEKGLVFNYPFELQDPQFAGDRLKLLRTAVRKLLGEVKSRMVANQEFHIWFTEERARRVFESEAGLMCQENPSLQRLVDALVQKSRIIHEDG